MGRGRFLLDYQGGMMLEQLEQLYQKAQAALEGLSSSAALQEWESEYLGKKGSITLMLRSVGQIAAEERAAFGKRANAIRDLLAEAQTGRETIIREQELARDLETGEIDITLPGRAQSRGGLHPATITFRELYRIWGDMGFLVYRSRDVETDEMNFSLLNIPEHHPARDMQDTFYTTDPNVILRTHTSPGQIRSMHELGADGTKPVRVILPGMCYRSEQVTARSEMQFHQLEGVVVGRNIRMSDLKGTMAEFARRMFGKQARVRFRASYFPFTEPSMEVDVECFVCGGEGCRICKYSGWLEISGAGMMHPTVLRNGGYDPREWSGFAFGMGPERQTMLKHKMTDIRYFWGNDLRFLEQF
jgi:phenylalanyl-tRNA synthetase alpha chain